MTEQAGFIDLFGSMPTAERLAFEIFSWGSDPGYSGTFRDRWATLQALPKRVVAEVAAMPKSAFPRDAVRALVPYAREAADVVRELRESGAVKTVLHNLLPTMPGLSNDDLGRITTAFPDDLIGFARVDPREGPKAANEIRRCVKEFGFRGVTVTPFWHKIKATDSACSAIYEACIELNVPIWIHTSMNWVRTTPLSYEHPLHLDEIAGRYPELRIIAGHGGWPWIADMVAVAWRQPNVYLDTTAFRPRHLATPGSGWDMLWYFMSRTLRAKVLFGSTWSLLGVKLAEVIAEARSLGLDSRTERAWLHDNAAQSLGLG